MFKSVWLFQLDINLVINLLLSSDALHILALFSVPNPPNPAHHLIMTMMITTTSSVTVISYLCLMMHL